MFNKNNNYYQFPKLEEGNFKILACFTRSFDINHKDKGRLHLISSAVLCNYELNYELAAENHFNMFSVQDQNDDSRRLINNNNYYIIEVVNDDNWDLNNYNNTTKNYNYEYLNYRQLKIIKVPLSLIVGILSGKNIHIDDTILNILYGDINDSKKNSDLVGSNTMFIFKNITWSSIVLYFKLMGVEISGGTSPKRHLLNTVDATLKEFLDILFCFKSDFIKKYIIYESQKKSSKDIISSSISLPFFKQGLEYLTKGESNLEEMRMEQIKNIYDHFKQKDELEKFSKIEDKILIYILLTFILVFLLFIKKKSFFKYKDLKIDELEKNIKLLEETEIENNRLIKYIEKQLSIFNKVTSSEDNSNEILSLDSDFDYKTFTNKLEITKRQLEKDLHEKEKLNKILTKRIEEFNNFKNDINNSKINELIQKNSNLEKNYNKIDLKRRLDLRRKDKGIDTKGQRYYSTAANSTNLKVVLNSEVLNNNLKLPEEILKDKFKAKLINNNVGDKMIQSLNINNNRGGVSTRNSSGLNQIITEITTNPMYVKISQILNSSVDPSIREALNNRDKQLQIEETLRFFWNHELSKVFEGKKSLFSNSIGINILMNSISKLDKVLNIRNDSLRGMSKPPTSNELRQHQFLCESHDKVLFLMNSVEMVLVCGFAYFIGPKLKPNLPLMTIPLPQHLYPSSYPNVHQDPNFYRYSFLLPFFNIKSKRVQSMFKFILFIFLFIIFIYYITPYMSFLNSNPYLIKVFIILFSSMIIFYLFLTGLIILNYSIRKNYDNNNKESVTSKYLPKFIKHYLLHLEEISKFYNYNSFVKLHFMSGTILSVLLITFVIIIL